MGSCYDLRKYISDFLENKLEPQLRIQVENHLKECPECMRSVKNTGYLQDRLANLRRYKCSEDFASKLHKRIHSPEQKVFFTLSLRRFSYAFTAVLVIFLSVYTIRWIDNQPEEVIIPPSSVREPSGNEEETVTNADQQDVNIKTKESLADQTDSLNTTKNANGRIKYVDQQ
jgi:predicted anti-sigma-YlaC factor YlaD